MVPKILPTYFVTLQGYKSFFIKRLAERMVDLRLDFPAIEKECRASLTSIDAAAIEGVGKKEKWVTKKQVKKASEGEAVTHPHAVAIVEALERLRLSSKAADTLSAFVEDEVIIGAIFYIDSLHEVCEKEDVKKRDIAEPLHKKYADKYGASKQDIEGMLDQLMAKNRVTLPLALDVVRVLNELLKSKGLAPLDPRQVITANSNNLRRAPCGWQVLEPGPYDEWPPTGPLRSEDDPEAR